ncbi:MAG: hypothetical protein ICV87_14435 [Gemmatimonadetes bacterium]|nr:hypothetical protein [Gemmatimonadota bacterium]
MKKISAVLGALLALAASGAQAQVFSPTFQAPYRSNDVGLYISDFEDGLGIEGILRRGMGSYDLGLRLGLVEDAILLGADARSPLSIAGTAPLAIALTFGGQAALGDANVFGAQAGLSIGHAFALPEATITPYIHPAPPSCSARGRATSSRSWTWAWTWRFAPTSSCVSART